MTSSIGATAKARASTAPRTGDTWLLVAVQPECGACGCSTRCDDPIMARAGLPAAASKDLRHDDAPG
jgi:hypothetical protein